MNKNTAVKVWWLDLCERRYQNIKEVQGLTDDMTLEEKMEKMRDLSPEDLEKSNRAYSAVEKARAALMPWWRRWLLKLQFIWEIFLALLYSVGLRRTP